MRSRYFVLEGSSYLPKNKNIEKNLLTLFFSTNVFQIMEEKFWVYHLFADDDSWITEQLHSEAELPMGAVAPPTTGVAQVPLSSSLPASNGPVQWRRPTLHDERKQVEKWGEKKRTNKPS